MEGLAAIGRGEVGRARQCVERAHAASQNAPLLHAGCHLGRAVVSAREGRLGLASQELGLGLMAGPASVVRRVSGLQPGQDNGASLWKTWSDRHVLRAVTPVVLEL